MNAIFAEMKPPPPPLEDEKPKRPLKIKDQPVSRDGSFVIGFSQKLQVPDFIDSGNSAAEGSRLLANDTDSKVKIPLSQLDVTRDIFSLRFILASKIDPKTIKYFLQINRWDETGLDVFVNFTDPMQISRGDNRDFVEISIKKPELFTSAETGQIIDTSSLVFYQTIPR